MLKPQNYDAFKHLGKQDSTHNLMNRNRGNSMFVKGSLNQSDLPKTDRLENHSNG
jgi:hypothetical protein